MPSEYHHGDLPTALRAAAVELLAERGPAGFSLREVARRAGVSHAAPSHHFGDAQGLLSSVAAEGFSTLTKAMREATEGIEDPRERLLACGRAYVNTALDNPGHYAVMVTHEFTNQEEPNLQHCSFESYLTLLENVEWLRDNVNADLDVEATATLLWAGGHGIVELSPVIDDVAEHTDTRSHNIDELLEAWTDMVLNGIRPR
ncbi:MAG: TetR/AcrR family transcriptional regulator [Actinomycetota bacterium]